MKKMSLNKAQQWLTQHYNSGYHSVKQFYANPSVANTIAETIIMQQMAENGGQHYRVLSGNCFYFVAAYIIPNNRGTMGRFIVETHANTYYYDFN